MQLWTDLIDPATLTGYARESLADYEARQGTLARWLPNRYVEDIIVQFWKGATGLVDIANFRAYDAELEIGKREKLDRVTIEIPALGQNLPVSEYEQLRGRGGTPEDQAALRTILNTTRQVVRAVADAAEYLRGVVLVTGKATVDQSNFQMDDDFGRSASHTLTAGSPWSSSSVDRLSYLETICDQYEDTNGQPAGCMLMDKRVFRALASGDQFQTQLLNGGARPATADQVNAVIEAAGLPPIILQSRRVSVNGVSTKVVRNDTLLLLPEPVDPEDEAGTDLGATTWGRTLSSMEPGWAIEDGEQPGIVVGVYKSPKPPMTLEVMSDAIALPHLANANRSLAAKVL